MVVKKNKPKVNIVFKSILGIVILLIVFSLIVSMMGFRNFTDALLDQYSDGAFRTANTAVMEFDVSKIEDYAASGGTTDEYIAALENMKKSVEEFVGDAPQFDDLTMLGVKLLRK